MGFLLCTSSVAVAERLGHRHDTVGGSGLSFTTPVDTPPFGGTVRVEQLGPVRVATTDAGPVRIGRHPRGITRDPAAEDDVTVLLQDSGRMVIDRDGRQTVLPPGTLAFHDATRPFTFDLSTPYRTHVFHIPREMLGLCEADLRRIARTPVRADTGTAALVIQFLTRFATDIGTHRPHIRAQLARHAVDLLATLAAERLEQEGLEADGDSDAASTALRQRVKAYIEVHLADPDLSPGVIAAAHHISVRHLHRLFRAEDTTVSRWIQHRRLAACRRELGRPGRSAPTVTAVAHRYGFTSASHFSRAFRAAYGVPPREWRASVLGGV